LSGNAFLSEALHNKKSLEIHVLNILLWKI
jgi:hypothetical protein